MSSPSISQSLGLTSSELADHSSSTKSVISLNVAFMTTVTLVTGIRLSIRLFMVRAAGLDDLLMLLATLSTLILSTFALLGTHFGLGAHIWLLVPGLDPTTASSDIDFATVLPLFLVKVKHLTQCLYGCYLAYATAITLVKASIIVSYLRIFPDRPFRRCMYGTLVLVVAMWICSVFAIIFDCVPVAAAWDYTLKGRCIDILSYFYVSSAINIFEDFVLVLAPLPLFWGMNMSRPKRIVLCGLFGVGIFACAASILRLAQLHGLHAKDITYTAVPSLNWSVAEVSTAILCACIPTMRPLAVAIIPSLYPSSLSGNSETRSGTRSFANKNGTAGMELERRSGASKRTWSDEDAKGEGHWEGGWGVLGERDVLHERGDESVDMKDILRDGCVPKKYLEAGLPPTPKEKRMTAMSGVGLL